MNKRWAVPGGVDERLRAQMAKPPGGVAAVGLVILAILSPLALGSVAPWARSILFAATGLLVATYLLAAAQQRSLRLVKHPAWWGVGAFLVLAGVTLIPMNLAVLGFVQPGTATLYGSVGIGADESRALTIAPGRTVDEGIRVLALLGLFALALHSLVTMRRIAFVVAGLIALGLFQSLYGFYAQYAGEHQIFGEPHRYASAAVTGTFLNKNHFAGLLEMIVPLSLGAVLALCADGPVRRRTPKAWRLRIARLVSSPAFLLRVGLFAACAVMTVALMLSLSRAGVVSLGVGIGFVTLAALLVFGIRRFALVPAALFVVAIAVGGAIGLDQFAARVGDAATMQSAQWHDRLDLSASGVDYAVDFPLFGTGLGTLGALFPKYQSGRFGDSFTDYLHNDWLQLVCETGIVGATLAIVSLAIFLLTVVGGLRRVRGPARWLAIGATGGVVAMLVHSFFDYNLTRITSNAFVFCLLLAIAYRATRLTPKGRVDRRFAVVPLDSFGARAATRVAAALLVAGTIAVAFPRAQADIAANRYLAAAPEGKTNDYFLLVAEAPSEQAIDEAIDACPWNAGYRYAAATRSMRRAEDLVRRAAARAARVIAGEADPRRVAAVAASLEPDLRAQLRLERKPHLVAAAAHLRAAIDRAPTNADYHLDLAAIVAELDGHRSRANGLMDVAYSLAPNRPRVMIAYGVHLLAGGADNDETAKTIRRCFRDAIAYDPANARDVLTVARRAYGDPEALVDVTPATVSAYGNLVIELWQDAAWPALHRSLDTLDRLATDPTVRADTAARRCAVFARQGDWPALRVATKDAVARRRRSLQPIATTIRAAREAGRNPEAFAQALAYLGRDWSEPDVTITAAEVASLPRMARHLDALDAPLRILLRGLLSVETITPSQSERIASVVHLEMLRDSRQSSLAALVEGVALYRMGHFGESVERLSAVTGGPGAHLADLFVGHAEARRGRRTRAVDAYTRVLRVVPNHLEALERLIALNRTDYLDRAAALRPAQPATVDFGGRVELLGYALERSGEPLAPVDTVALGRSGDRVSFDDEPQWMLVCYWRIRGTYDPSYQPSVHFLASDGTILARADHRLDPVDPAVGARYGEVVVVRRPVAVDPRRVASMRVGLIGDGSQDAHPHLVPAWGERYVELKPRVGTGPSPEARS